MAELQERRSLEPLLDHDDTWRGDVAWARDEVHNFIVATFCPDHWTRCLTWNPAYFVALALAVPSIVMGKWVHGIVGQGGPLRDDEGVVERQARIITVYMNDGLFALGFVSAAANLSFLDGLLNATYVVGNMFFLDAMRRRDLLATRVAIAANVAFASGIAALLALQSCWHSRWTRNEVANAVIRSLALLFFIDDALTLVPLWSVYLHDRRGFKRSGCHYLAILSAALLVWALFFLAVALGGPKLIWGALV